MSEHIGEKRFWKVNTVVSLVILGAISWLLLGRPHTTTSLNLSFMPGVNATLNGIAAVLICLGLIAIRSGRRELHKLLMISAFIASTLFFIGYAAYHYTHGDTPYQGQGTLRLIYFSILISHIALSVALVPMAFGTLYLAASKRFEKHKKLARFTFPVWLYVSVTGVVIYFMLYRV